ncbi:MAG TPA: CBS domain-containing protein, partial [bacterium]|nr:CBS domain-containing protein [bacterium]
MEPNDQIITVDPQSSPRDIAQALSGLHPADAAHALARANIDGELLTKILSELDTDLAADVVINLDEHTVEDILDVLEPPEIAEITTELESDDAADVVGLLDEDKKARVLSQLDTDYRRAVEDLLQYTDESAGGIMASELVYVKRDASVDDAIALIRAAADEVEEIHNVYITDRGGKLSGVLSLGALLLARRGTRVGEIMESDVVS